MLKQVTSTTGFSPRRRLTPAARALASMLIFLITWGATVEAVHQHGNSQVNFQTATSTFTSGGLNQTQQPSQAGECLICQVHRQLTSGLLYGSALTLTSSTQHAPSSIASIPYLSTSSTPQRGRAPPQTSLT